MRSISFLILIFLLFPVLSCSRIEIPVIHVYKEGPVPWDKKEKCEIIYGENGNTTQLEGEIKRRGGLSSRYGKPNFALELDKKIDFCGLPSDDDWIINASYIDKTFMRHKISYDLFRQMGDNNIASLCNYAELYLNDNYMGLFVIMEEVNGGMVELDKSDPQAAIFKDPPVFIEEKLDWIQEEGNYYQQKFPRIEDRDMTFVMDSMKNFLFYSSDKVFAEKIDSWFDIENVVDWHLLLLLSNNGDGVKKNFYLYKLNKNTPFRFAIWDYDHSFGRDGDNEMNMMEREPDIRRAVLIRRLMDNPYLNYNEMLRQKYWILRKEKIFSLKYFEEMISRNDPFIRPCVERNAERWPLDEKWYFDSNNYDQELEIMIEYMKLRIPFLDDLFTPVEQSDPNLNNFSLNKAG